MTEKDVVYTRADFLSQVPSVFDPLGSVAPITAKGRIRQRELGIRGLGWAYTVDDKGKEWWKSWFTKLWQLNYVDFPRSLFPDEDHIVKIRLHTFFNASAEVYAAVVYIRNVYDDGRIDIRHVKGGIKLAPLKMVFLLGCKATTLFTTSFRIYYSTHCLEMERFTLLIRYDEKNLVQDFPKSTNNDMEIVKTRV